MHQHLTVCGNCRPEAADSLRSSKELFAFVPHLFYTNLPFDANDMVCLVKMFPLYGFNGK
jgi:hypothetical protein